MLLPTLESRLAMRDYPTDSLPLMEQKWRNLLFLHWEYEPEDIQKTLPKGLFADQFNGKSYIGLAPFYMKDIRVKMMPVLPGLSDLLELNVRTYVFDEAGVPGVWFYSLDANSRLAVQMANSFFYLPYVYAEIESSKGDHDEIHYHCQRPGAELSADFIYQPKGKEWLAEPGSLEFFLIERYVLFVNKGDNRLARGRVHHSPYSLSDAHVSKWSDQPFEWNDLKRPGRLPDHVCFSPGANVNIFSLTDLAQE